LLTLFLRRSAFAGRFEGYSAAGMERGCSRACIALAASSPRSISFRIVFAIRLLAAATRPVWLLVNQETSAVPVLEASPAGGPSFWPTKFDFMNENNAANESLARPPARSRPEARGRPALRSNAAVPGNRALTTCGAC
jgi:hypothetical protein